MKITKIICLTGVLFVVELRCMEQDLLTNELNNLHELLTKFQDVIIKISRSPEENKIAQAQSDIEDLIDKARLAQAADKNAESIQLYQQALDTAVQFKDNVAINDLAIEIYTRQLPLIAQTSNLDQIITAGTKASDYVGLIASRVTRNENLAMFSKFQKLINSLNTIADTSKKLTKDNALLLVGRILVNGQSSVELMQNEQFSSFKPHFNKLFKLVNTKLIGPFFEISNKAQKEKLAQLIKETE